MSADEGRARDSGHLALMVGGVLALIGGLGYFVLLLVHGDLPDQTTAAALEHIAGRPEWPLLKWLLLACVFCWVGAFGMLARSMRSGRGRVLSHLALLGVTIGASLVFVEYSVMGHGVKNVADTWASSTGTEQQVALIVGEALLGVTGGLFLNFISWLIGLPFLLMGLALAYEPGYPRWMGWAAALAGTGAFVSGAGRFLGVLAVPFPVLYGGFIVPLALWLAATGVLMMRRARTQTDGHRTRM